MKEGFENISLEVLPEYMGGHIFVYGPEDEGANQILHSELWKGLPAVKKGQVYMYGSFSDKEDEFVTEDPYSLDLQLDTIVNLLLTHKKIKLNTAIKIENTLPMKHMIYRKINC